MADNSNLFKIEGVLYKKISRPWKNDKGEGEFKSIILETSRQYKKKGADDYGIAKDFPEFQLGYGLNYDDYSIGDLLNVTFSLRGKEIKLKGRPEPWHKTELVALYLKYGTLDNNNRPAKSNKVQTDSMTDPKELDNSMFPTPEPGVDDDDMSDLPF